MQIKINTTEILTYRGNSNFFSALLEDEKNNFYICIGKTQGIDIIHEIGKNLMFDTEEEYKLEIPLYPNEKGHMFTLIKLNNSDEYFTITKVLEAIL